MQQGSRAGRPSDGAFAVALLLLGAIVVVPCLGLILWSGFDGPYGQDAFAYVNYASGPLADAMRQLRLPPPFFFPPGYPLVVAVLNIAGLGADHAAQAVSLVSGAAVPILVALLARELRPLAQHVDPNRFALAAGLVAAVPGQLWQSAVVTMSDTFALALATAGILSALRYARGARSAWALLAVALIVAATETRLIYAAVALSAVVPLLVGMARRNRRERVRDGAAAVVVALAVAAPALVPIADALWNGLPPPFVGQLTVHSWNPLNAVSASFDTADGRLAYVLPMAVFYIGQPVAPYWFAALGLLAAPGLLAVARGASRLAVAVLLLWPALVLGFLVGDAYQNTRFFHAAMPPVAILIAAGMWAVWRAGRRVHPRGGPIVVAVLASLLMLNAALALRFTSAFIDRLSADNRALRTLAAQIPPGARVISLGATPLLLHDGVPALELTAINPDALRQAIPQDVDTYLLVDLSAIRSQWAGRQPEVVVDAIYATSEAETIGRAGPWTLVRVRRHI